MKEIAERIKSDECKELCMIIESLYKEEERWAGIDEIKRKSIKKQRQKVKENLPNVIFSSSMRPNGIGYEFLQNATGLIAMDFDDIKNLESIVQKIKEDPHVLLAYKTPSAGGLRIVVKSNLPSLSSKDTTGEQESVKLKRIYEYLYFHIGNSFANKYGIILDSRAKDITRRNYLAYDPQCHYNPGSEVYEAPDFPVKQKHTSVIPEKKERRSTKSDSSSVIQKRILDNVIDYVDMNEIDITSDYLDWIYLGWLCKSIYGPDENDIIVNFHRISQHYPGYDAQETYLKIKNIIYDKSTRTTVFYALRVILTKFHLDFLFDNMANDSLKVKPYQLQEIFTIEKIKIVFDEIKEVHVVSCPFILKGKELVLEESGDLCLNHIISHLEQRYKVTFKTGDIDRNLKTSPNKILYNRPKDVLSKVKTPDPEYYNKFFDLIEFDEEKNDKDYYKTIFTRWLLGCFHNWLRTDKRKYDEMLVLSEPRGNIGKTNFINDYLFNLFKTPLFTYISENKNFGDQKDKDYFDAKSLVAYKSEIKDDLKKRYGNVKSYMSQRHVQVRNPYNRYTGDYLSTCSYIGDTNEYNFLPSEVNLRRFIIIPITRLNFSDKSMRNVTPFDWSKFWGYLYWQWADQGKEYVDFDLKDHNEAYIDETAEISVLRKVVVSSPDPVSIFKIHQDISSCQDLNLNINVGELKKIIQNLGFRTTTSVRCKISGKVVRGWNCRVDTNKLFESTSPTSLCELTLPADFIVDKRNDDIYQRVSQKNSNSETEISSGQLAKDEEENK
jgi:hypothetical protein